jgi:hypothetical protein
MFVSVANGYVMPLKGMIVGNNKTKKMDAVHSTETSSGYRQDVRGDNRLKNTGLTHYGHLKYSSVAEYGDKCTKIQ